MHSVKQNRTLKESVARFKYFIEYAHKYHWKDVLLAFIVNFVLGLLPYFIVYWYIRNEIEENKLAFFGDGSIIIFCFSVLLSHLVLVVLNNSSDQEVKKTNTIIMLLVFLLLIIALLIFIGCQINFSRTWTDVNRTGLISAFYLFISMPIVFYLIVDREVEYSEFDKYIKARDAERLSKKAESPKTDENLRV